MDDFWSRICDVYFQGPSGEKAAPWFTSFIGLQEEQTAPLSVMYLNGTSKTRFEMKSMDLGLFGLKGTWKPCSWSISFKKNQEIFFPRT
jgi:hypothetical protein